MELAAQGEKESPLEKYYRLKLESEELIQEINSLQVIFKNLFNIIIFNKIKLYLMLLLDGKLYILY